MSTATSGHTGRAIYTGLTAAGSTQATALQLAGRGDSLVELTSVPSSSGVMLPPPILPMKVEIANQGANTLSIYPQVGGTIDNGTVNAAITLAAGKAAVFEASSLTNWYTVSTTDAGAGTVTSVGAGTGLAGGTITSTGTISLATIAAGDVMANTTGGTAAPAGVTLSALIDDAIGSTHGDILYRGASTWSALAPGSSGNVLTSGGSAANPSWSSAGSGTVTSVTFTGDGTVLSSTPSSAVTTTGTVTTSLANQSANEVLAGPASGSAAAPTFRALGNADLPAGVPILQFALTNSVTISSPASTGTLVTGSTSPRGSLTIASGALNSVGKILEVDFAGYASSASSSPGGLGFYFYMGGNAVGMAYDGAMQANKTDLPFAGRFVVVVKSTGSAGTVDVFGTVLNLASGVFPAPVVAITNGNTTTYAPQTPLTVNLTGTVVMDFLAYYTSTAISGNTITLTQFNVKLLP